MEEKHEHLVLFDLALDYATTPRLGLARADQCGMAAFRTVVRDAGAAPASRARRSTTSPGWS